MSTVADSLLEVLVHAGVRRIYGVVGDSLNSFSDAVRRSGGAAAGGVDWVHVHNEEGAAFAASAIPTSSRVSWTRSGPARRPAGSRSHSGR
jgi:thiamine pyrophosphate-dependent acetolactate synthase large subunit-like protein